ncbi:hypothetical protein HDV02_004214 [Globomyces sp. JEL0801]|nr:hypothetical protein HDV02_004214 [Globomyces sp. JEL0801]
MSVLEITSHQQYLETIATKDKVVIVDYTATWCGPCKQIKPVFADLARKYTNALFCSLDVDAVKESAQLAGITAMPTFHKNGAKIHEMKGANKAGLETIVKQLAGAANVTSSSGPSTSSNVVAGQVDLQPFISKNVECLNSDVKHPIQNIFNKDDSVLKSDSDEQLILSISFNQPVKIHSLKFLSKSESGPKTIKTFVNAVSTMSFDDVESQPAIDSIELTPEDLKDGKAPVPLRFVKYQSVHHLTIFVFDNQDGSDVTELQQLQIYGSPIEATKDVNQLKDMGDGHDH